MSTSRFSEPPRIRILKVVIDGKKYIADEFSLTNENVDLVNMEQDFVLTIDNLRPVEG